MPPLFGYENLAILSEDNPVLVELSKEHDSIIQQFNELNEQITSEQVPPDPNFAEQQRYHEYEDQTNDLQISMLEWES